MTLNLPPKVRIALYLLTVVGTPVVAYLFAKKYVGELEVTLWSAEVAVAGVVAAFNVDTSKK